MRHLKAGRKLNRNAEHRAALLRNLARALFEHGRIITTVAKAKEVRPFVEKLITLAKKNTLHTRRLAISRLHDEATVSKLFKEIGPRFAERPGGYTRIIKRHERRLGDAGATAYIELLRADEPVKKTKAAAPAPRVTETPPAPAPQAPPTEPTPETPPAPTAEKPAEPPAEKPAENPPAAS